MWFAVVTVVPPLLGPVETLAGGGRAALTGRTIGDLLTEAIRVYLGTLAPLPKRASLRDLEPEEYPEGNERLSESVDAIVYGGR